MFVSLSNYYKISTFLHSSATLIFLRWQLFNFLLAPHSNLSTLFVRFCRKTDPLDTSFIRKIVYFQELWLWTVLPILRSCKSQKQSIELFPASERKDVILCERGKLRWQWLEKFSHFTEEVLRDGKGKTKEACLLDFLFRIAAIGEYFEYVEPLYGIEEGIISFRAIVEEFT